MNKDKGDNKKMSLLRKENNKVLYDSIPAKDSKTSNIQTINEITKNNKIQNKINSYTFQNTEQEPTELQESDVVVWPYETAHDELNQQNRRHSTLSNILSFRNREDSIVSFLKKERSNTVTTIKNNYYRVIRYKHFKKFLSIITTCFLIWFIFTLAFLPRTSLARDFRRLHNSATYTKQEIYRAFSTSFEHSENQFSSLIDKFSQYNNLIGDDILTQITYNYLKQDLGFSVSVEDHEMTNIVYNFDISLKLEDAQGNHEEISLYEPLEEQTPNQLSGYILSDNLNSKEISYDVSGQYMDVGSATRTQFENLKHSPKNKIHLIRRTTNMSIDSQILNSMSYGGIGCLVYNEPGAFYDFEHANDTITRDYLLHDKLTNIPVIPISFSTAQKLILNSKDKTLHMKRNPKEDLVNAKDNDISFTNIQFTIPGIWKNHEIIIGCQRDTFTYNGYNSGNIIFLQLAKTFSDLLKKGWKPIRTIRFVSFDGNTMNNMATKEHFLKNQKNYQNSLVFIDINKDSIQGSREFICRTTNMFEQTILNTIRLMDLYDGDDEEFIDTLLDKQNLKTAFKIKNMKTKSSLASFLFDEHNVPTISCNFEDKEFAYPLNSNYMTKKFMNERIDPNDYELHKQLTKFYGLLVLTMDESEIVEYNLGNYMKDIQNRFVNLNKDGEYTNIVYWKHIETLLNDLTIIFESFDLYNQRLLKLAYTDYPWYKGFKKIKLLFKIRASNKRMFKMKDLFVAKIRKTFDEDIRYTKFNDVDDSRNLFYRVNDLEGGEIEFLGKFKEYVQLNDRQGLVKYLRDLYNDLQALKQYVLDEYPI